MKVARIAATAVVLLLGASSQASAQVLGGMSPIAKPIGCLNVGGFDGCSDAGPLSYAVGVVTSKDGKNVYITGYFSHTLHVYNRNPSTGALTAAGCFIDEARDPGSGCSDARGLNAANGLTLSPSGNRLYVAAEGGNAVAIFKRDANGVLTQDTDAKGCVAALGAQGCRTVKGLAGPRNIIAYGSSVYVSGSGNTLAILRVEEDNGLTQAAGNTACFQRNSPDTNVCQDGKALGVAEQMAIDEDGTTLYVGSASDDAILLFTRSTLNGDLAQSGDAGGCLALAPLTAETTGCTPISAPMDEPEGLMLSRDGNDLYVTSRAGAAHAILLFDRGATGLLSLRTGTDGCIASNTFGGTCRTNRGINLPFSIIESPDEKHVYVASVFGYSVTGYTRAGNGVLTPIAGPSGCAFGFTTQPDCAFTDWLNQPQGLAISPDGRFLYTANIGDSISVIHRDVTGPTCSDGSASVVAGQSTTLTLSCSDADGDPVTISKVSDPGGGLLGTVDPNTGSATFLAGAAPMTTSFTFKALANGIESAPATFTITITPAPVVAPPACTPRTEIPGNGVDEDCNGVDAQVPPVPKVEGTVRPVWIVFSSHAVLTRLRLANVSAGAKLEIRCKGRGCPFKKKTFPVRNGNANASKPFKGRKLRPGVVVEVRLTRPGAIGKVVSYKIRKGKKIPIGVARCLPVGSTKPAAC